MYDVVTVGEGMLRLSPPPFERLRRARSLDVHVCGSQGNVACNLGQLGLKSAFVTKVPDNSLGLLMRDHYRGCGVDCEHMQLVPEGRVGVNFIEFGATPRPSRVVYDRKSSAASTMAPADFDWKAILNGGRVAYTDGILPGLSRSCRATAQTFFSTARELGLMTAFDINYREHLWSPDEARETMEPLAAMADLLVTSPVDAATVFGIEGSEEQVAAHLAERCGCRSVGVTMGSVNTVLKGHFDGLLWHKGQVFRSNGYEVDAIDRFGAGDAWCSGLIYGLLVRDDPQYALSFANAFCALHFTMPGDVVRADLGEVEALMNSRDFNVKR